MLFKKYTTLALVSFLLFSSLVSVGAQNISKIPFVVYNSEKVFRNSELGQEIIRAYNRKVQLQLKKADAAAKKFENEEQELVAKRSELSSQEFKILADDFDKRVRETRILHKNADNEIGKLYGTWKENFFNETIPRAFKPISKEYDVYAAVDLATLKNLVYRENIEDTELFIAEINKFYKENKSIFDVIVKNDIKR